MGLFIVELMIDRLLEISTKTARKKIADDSLKDIHLESRVGISEFVTVRAATVALEAVTNRKFTKNMQQKKEKVS